MERLVILCCFLLYMVSVSNGALCISNTVCPYDQAWCVEDCSEVAVKQFNLTASHGNCKISSTSGGSNSDIIYGCHIDSCSTNPCVASRAEDTDEISCCCTENFCNTNFTVSPTTPTHQHIYSSFPTHTTPDQLVCEFYNCSNGANCVHGYEVCDEGQFSNYDDGLVCIAVLYKNITKTKILFKGCFVDESDPYNETCVLEEHPWGDYYTCICNSTLCNSNGTLVLSNHTSTIPPTDATEAVPTGGNTDGFYTTYPQHVKPDELVCVNHNCDGEVCDTLYEVCSENPEFKNYSIRFTCYSMFIVELDTLNYISNQLCFPDSDSPCPEECVPELFDSVTDTALFDCCCVGNLCNNITFNATGQVLPLTTVTKGNPAPYTTPTVSTTSDNKSNYVPFVYGIAAGVCLLIVLTIVIIVIVAYRRTKTRRLTQSVSYNKLINS